MRRSLSLATAGAVFGAALAVGIPAPGGPAGVALVSEAGAQELRGEDRRVARRTARRTTRRVDYRDSLPSGCVRRGAYWYCGGVYYNAVVQNGVTVYVVVTP